jgi:hypothetical protein
MPFGYLDTTYIDLPDNIDETYLRGLEMRSGLTMEEMMTLIDQRLAAFNGSIPAMVAMLISPTTEAETDGRGATPFDVHERGEYNVPRGQQNEVLKHMLPLRGYDVATNWTEDGLEEMSRQSIENQIDGIIMGLRNQAIVKTLTRLFSDAEMRVQATSTASSPGFAGSGTGANVFGGAYPDGRSLPSGYSHYYAADTDASGEPEATIYEAVKRLAEWHDPPFDLLAPSAQVNTVQGFDDFYDAGSALVRRGNVESEAQVDASMYVGVLATEYGDVRVHRNLKRTSDSVIAIFKTYGNLDPRNPLAWRYDEEKGRGAYLRSRSLFPLSNAVVRHDYGIGVSDRTAAVLISTGSGESTYNAPTIS